MLEKLLLMIIPNRIQEIIAVYHVMKKEMEIASRELEINALPIIPFVLPADTRGIHCSMFGGIIFFSIRKRHIETFTNEKIHETVFHEMRHQWQHLRFPIICKWYETHQDFYATYYFTPYVWTEEDARHYGRADRATRKLMMNARPPYTVKELDQWYRNHH